MGSSCNNIIIYCCVSGFSIDCDRRRRRSVTALRHRRQPQRCVTAQRVCYLHIFRIVINSPNINIK